MSPFLIVIFPGSLKSRPAVNSGKATCPAQQHSLILLRNILEAYNTLSDIQKTIHFFCLALDVSLNISTSHFTSTLSTFQVILQ